MNRVLVHIPKNVSNGLAAMRFTAERDAAVALVSEGRLDKNSHYAGAEIVPVDQYSLHRFKLGKNGEPAQDESIQSMTRAEMEERDAQLMAVNEADVSTVGDMSDQLALLQEQMLSMKREVEKSQETILAQDRELSVQKERAATLGEPKVKAKAKAAKK